MGLQAFWLLYRCYVYDFLILFYGVGEGDFSAAFAGGGGFLLIVVNDTKMAFIYHFVVSFDIGGFA